LAAASLLIASPKVFAQKDWPNKPIKIIVPFAPGGIADTLARLLQPYYQVAFGQPIIIENKTGASGTLATSFVAKSTPDGYTFLLCLAAPQTLSQHLSKLDYDGTKDFAPVSLINTNPLVVLVNPSLPINNIAELIAYAKANPGKLAYATGNTTGIVATAQILSLAGNLNMLHVPYKGEPAAVIDLVSNRVQLMISTPFTAGVHAAEGKLKMLAITLPSRSALAPDVPTFAEAGINGFSVQSWAALYAPANLPAELLTRLNTAVNAVLSRPDIKEQLDQKQFLVQGSTSEALGAFTKEQAATYVKILRDAGVQPE
jgi:tripartite-type tricarboxylate transporter receptor subunit TctC